jgi:hypothetical protein
MEKLLESAHGGHVPGLLVFFFLTLRVDSSSFSVKPPGFDVQSSRETKGVIFDMIVLLIGLGRLVHYSNQKPTL